MICIQLFQRLPLLLYRRKKKEDQFINSWQFNVEKTDHIPHSSQCLIEIQNYVCSFASFQLFHHFPSIVYIHFTTNTIYVYVRYGNDNVILFIGYLLSFSKSEPKQVANSLSYRLQLHKVKQKKNSLNEVISTFQRHFDDANIQLIKRFLNVYDKINRIRIQNVCILDFSLKLHFKTENQHCDTYYDQNSKIPIFITISSGEVASDSVSLKFKTMHSLERLLIDDK